MLAKACIIPSPIKQSTNITCLCLKCPCMNALHSPHTHTHTHTHAYSHTHVHVFKQALSPVWPRLMQKGKRSLTHDLKGRCTKSSLFRVSGTMITFLPYASGNTLVGCLGAGLQGTSLGLCSVMGSLGPHSGIGSLGLCSFIGSLCLYSVIDSLGPHSVIGSLGFYSVIGSLGLYSVIGSSGLCSVIGYDP